jgi:membrane fusion protein, multidrug efflux system
VNKAELDLSYTTITSPYDGMAGKSNFREGALITTYGNQGLLTTVSALDPMWVDFNISESDLLKMKDEEIKGRLEYPKDMAFVAEILLLNNVIFPESGKVDFAAPMINPATGTLNMRASFPNPKGSLKPGQFVRIRLEGAVRPNALIVPQRSILQGSKGKFVFIKDSDSKAQLRYVDVGDWYGDYWIINSGLQAGEEVIVDGAGKVDEGSVVNVIKTLPMPVFEESPPSENIQNH